MGIGTPGWGAGDVPGLACILAAGGAVGVDTGLMDAGAGPGAGLACAIGTTGGLAGAGGGELAGLCAGPVWLVSCGFCAGLAAALPCCPTMCRKRSRASRRFSPFNVGTCSNSLAC